MKNESSFEVIILREVVLAFYRSEFFCEKKKLGFGLVVLKCLTSGGRVLGLILKIDHRLFRAFGLEGWKCPFLTLPVYINSLLQPKTIAAFGINLISPFCIKS